MDKEKIIQKFGKDYYCDDFSFMMGIDVRFAMYDLQTILLKDLKIIMC